MPSVWRSPTFSPTEPPTAVPHWARPPGCTPWAPSRRSRSRAATRRSTARSSNRASVSARARRLLLRALQLVFVAAVFVYGGDKVADAWRDARVHGGADLVAGLRWGYLAAATGVVLVTYLLLIQLWRFILRNWGERLGLVDAMAIWSISSLG